MALKDFQSDESIARSKRGTYTQLGAKPVTSTKKVTPSGVADKAGDVASQTGSLIGAGLKKAGGFVVNSVKDAVGDAVGFGKTAIDYRTQGIKNSILNKQSEQLDIAQQKLQTAYKSGRISFDDYKKHTDDLSRAFGEISKESKKISAGPSPQERAEDLVSTAVNILSFGSWGLAQAGGKQALQAGLVKKGASLIDDNAVKALVNEAATPLENLIFKVPAARPLVERNLTTLAKREAQKLAGESVGQFMMRESKKIAVDFLIKRPVFYQTNIGDANKVYQKILDGDYPAALRTSAWMGAQMLNGGPLGFVANTAGRLKYKTGQLAYGTGSVIDEISKHIGDGNPNQIAKYLTGLKGKNGFEEAEGTYRILQEVNLRMSKNDATEAARMILAHYDQNGINLQSLTPARIARDMGNWARAEQLGLGAIRKGLVKGISKADAEKYVVVRWDRLAKRGLAEAMARVKTVEERLAVLEEMAHRPGVGWGNNEILMTRLRKIIETTENPLDVPKAIRGITTASTQLDGVPKKIADELNKLGYTIARPARGRKTPVVGMDETRKLITAAENGDNEIFDVATAPNPTLKSIAGFFERAGLSPIEAGPAATNRLSESVVKNLDELGLTKQLGINTNKSTVMGGRVILSRLQDYTEQKLGFMGMGKSAVSDIRQLRVEEIAEALGVSKEVAKKVSRAVMHGYAETPLAMRGLGDWVVDRLYLNPLHKYYARTQSALRYTYNPFFRAQERVETKLLSHSQANNLIWNRTRAELNDAAKLLDQSEIFTSSLSGAGAQDQVLGRITANITAGQKRDLAGLAMDLAEARGMTLPELLQHHYDEVDDMLRVVVQYPKKGVLASPLSRTLNLMFFPMRYNLKVTQLAAKVLERQPPAVQLAVIHSGFKMREWLKTDEGIRWQSDNADVLAILGWITPINSISYSFNLLNGKPESMAEFGQLGGLPLGFITQILDGQGIINLNRPYVNPKTGEVFPEYIPQTDKARAATALLDLIGTMFTYPGRILGLPGKETSIKKFVGNFIDTNSKDFKKEIRMDELTPLQQNFVRVLQGDTSEETFDTLYNSPAPGEFNWYTLPPIVHPLEEREPIKPVTRPKSSSTKRKKIAQPIPQR